MALPKSKTCRTPLPSGHSPLPLAALSLLGLILCDHIGFSSALKCYQARVLPTLANHPSNSGPTRPTDSSQRIAHGLPNAVQFLHQKCGLQPKHGHAILPVHQLHGSQQRKRQLGIGSTIYSHFQYTLSSSAVCQNSTGYPPQTFCCCYGDGCNSAIGLGGTSLTLLLLALGGATATLLWMHTN